MMNDFEKYIIDNPIKAASFHPYYEKALNEMVIAGGKRFRPNLMFAVINAFYPDLLSKSFNVGLAIEVIHTYSLVHDDLPVMDDADLRRGHPTLHKTYDETTATLVGDALNTLAFSLIYESEFSSDIRIELVGELAKNAGHDGMCLGQALDCFFENKKLDLDSVILIHKNKTGKCIAGPLKMGGIICGLDKSVLDNLYEFGLVVGLLFQVQDDIFDVTKSEEESMKSVGVDCDKNTFVTLLGLDGAISHADELVVKIEELLVLFDEDLRVSLKKLLDKYIYRHR